MRRSGILTPLSILFAGCVLIALLIFKPDGGSSAAPRGDIEDYEPPTQTAFAVQTLTALAAPTDYPAPEGTSTTTTTTTARPTGTVRSTVTPQRGAGVGTPTPTDSAFTQDVTPGTGTTTTAQGPVTPTATEFVGTPTATPDPNSLVCPPGETVAISGEGPPNAGFLVYFNERVVSGGTVRRDGRFDIGLKVGQEQGGNYTVEVRVRGSRQLLRSLTCQVPATTPTPLPQRPVR